MYGIKDLGVLGLELTDLVETLPVTPRRPLVAVPLESATYYDQSPSGRFHKRPFFTLTDLIAPLAKIQVHRKSRSLFFAAEVALVALSSLWMYNVTGDRTGAATIEPGLSITFRFLVYLVCFRKIWKFSETKRISALVAPLIYMAALIVAIVAVSADDAVADSGEYVQNYTSLVFVRSILVFSGFVANQLAL